MLKHFLLLACVGVVLGCDSGRERPCPDDESCHTGVLDLRAEPQAVPQGGSTTLSFGAENIELVDPATRDDFWLWEGHFHVYLDLDYFEQDGPDVEQAISSEYLVEGWEIPIDVALPTAVQRGRHTLSVILFGDDELPLPGAFYETEPAIIDVE